MNYRDDHQDNAVVSDGVWVNLNSTVTDLAKTVSGAIVGLAILLGDAALASDGVNDRAYTGVGDTAVAIDNVLGVIKSTAMAGDTLKIKEGYQFITQAVMGDIATTYDGISDKSVIVANESAVASDGYILNRISVYKLGDAVKAKDGSYQYAKETVSESTAVSDNAKITSIIKSTVGDKLTATDGMVSKIIQRINEGDTIKLLDGVETKITSTAHIVDWIMAEDGIFNGTNDSHQYGQAWTANTDNWAMSRYEPYSYDGLAVINGKLYGTNINGVYELNVINQPVTGSIKTGQMDITGGNLSYPIGAYLEYELGGQGKQATMAVTSTQRGIKQTYKYKLPTEKADYLTNGRFIFGRGLRGRHFGFELTITGTYAHINDMGVDVATGKRRV